MEWHAVAFELGRFRLLSHSIGNDPSGGRNCYESSLNDLCEVLAETSVPTARLLQRRTATTGGLVARRGGFSRSRQRRQSRQRGNDTPLNRRGSPAVAYAVRVSTTSLPVPPT